jgi:hypothetical protein
MTVRRAFVACVGGAFIGAIIAAWLCRAGAVLVSALHDLLSNFEFTATLMPLNKLQIPCHCRLSAVQYRSLLFSRKTLGISKSLDLKFRPTTIASRVKFSTFQNATSEIDAIVDRSIGMPMWLACSMLRCLRWIRCHDPAASISAPKIRVSGPGEKDSGRAEREPYPGVGRAGSVELPVHERSRKRFREIAVHLTGARDHRADLEAIPSHCGTYYTVEQTRIFNLPDEPYDALVLPGRVANPDALRTIPEAVKFVRSFFDSRKPIASICYGAWLLVEADIAQDHKLT